MFLRTPFPVVDCHNRQFSVRLKDGQFLNSALLPRLGSCILCWSPSAIGSSSNLLGQDQDFEFIWAWNMNIIETPKISLCVRIQLSESWGISLLYSLAAGCLYQVLLSGHSTSILHIVICML